MWNLYSTVFVVSTFLADPGERQCEWGKYGEHCNLTCPVNCALVPPRYVQYCDRDTGKCSGGCRSGWHGDLCDQSCSTNCLNKTCNQQTGHCTLGCYGNNMGFFCNDTQDCCPECIRGWYGHMCEHPCSSNCVEERCHQTTGVCVLGCSGTYTGEFCNITTASLTPAANKKEEIISLITIPGPVFLVGVLAVVIVVLAATVIQVKVFLRWWGHVKSSQRPATADGVAMLGDLLKALLQKTENSPLTNKNHGEMKDVIVL